MRKRRILVVEDDPALATMYETALSFAGFDVVVSGDGLTALENVDEEHPDLIVLDLRLPQLDGATILHEVASTPDTRDIPVIRGDRRRRRRPAAGVNGTAEAVRPGAAGGGRRTAGSGGGCVGAHVR